MVPLLRPGSIVLVDVSIRKIDDSDWATEHDRPMTGPCILSNYTLDTVVDGSTRMVRGS